MLGCDSIELNLILAFYTVYLELGPAQPQLVVVFVVECVVLFVFVVIVLVSVVIVIISSLVDIGSVISETYLLLLLFLFCCC